MSSENETKRTIRYIGPVYHDSHSVVYGWLEKEVNEKEKYVVNWDDIWNKVLRKERKEKKEMK